MIIAFYITFLTACAVVIPVYLYRNRSHEKPKEVNFIIEYENSTTTVLKPFPHPWALYMMNKK